MKIEIKNRWSGEVIFAGEHDSLGAAVSAAIACNTNLRGANLRGANLRDVGLYGADLRGANLRDVGLYGANLRGANLCGANLRGANLRGANLCGANLRGADLCDADLCGADLCDANLRGADLCGADLCDADLCGANLRDADLSPKEGTLDPLKSLLFTPDPNLPKRIAEMVIGGGGKLEMGNWRSCETTHCLAGWAIHLSGPAGYALEKLTSPSVAGAILCPSAAHLFFKSNDKAMEWCREQLK